MTIKKRDGTVEEFQFEKIKNAVEKAFDACGKDINDNVINCLKQKYNNINGIPTSVEEVQDSIEECLMNFDTDVARKYIIYRYEHKVIRENRDKIIKGLSKKLMAEDVQNQNANVDEFSFGGRIGEASRVVTKDYALNYCMSRKSRKNHLNNEIYIHDLDSYAVGEHNCLTIPFDELLSRGFNTRQTDVRPANSINTAFQLVAVLFQIQSLQQFGGVSASHLDWTMVPYVRKSFYKHFCDGLKYIDGISTNIDKENVAEISIDDKCYKTRKRSYEYAMNMTAKELKQAVEGFYHNLNTLQSRSGWVKAIASL